MTRLQVQAAALREGRSQYRAHLPDPGSYGLYAYKIDYVNYMCLFHVEKFDLSTSPLVIELPGVGFTAES